LKREDIIINALTPIYDNLGYDKELESPRYKLKSVTVEFLLKQNAAFSGKYNILTKVALNDEEIKDKIIEVINS
jgi:hypothetical protein